MKKSGVALITALLLSACSSDVTWIRAGSTQQDFNRESVACQTNARHSISRNDELSSMRGRFDSCMLANGWQLRKKSDIEAVQNMSPARKEYLLTVNAIMTDYKAEQAACNKRAFAREFKTYVAVAKCYDKHVKEIFERHHFPRMDIVDLLKAKRIETATMLDNKQMSGPQADKELADYAKEMLQSATPQ